MTVERYRRVDYDHLEMILNITDPQTYLRNLEGDKRSFNW
jgi:hypothetical protein